MDRVIKFRGLYVFEGNCLYPAERKWIYGYLYIEDGKHYIKDISNMRMTYLVDSKTVGQYAEFKAKGIEVYDGDIVNMIVKYPDTFADEIVKEFVVMPGGDIVVKIESGESLWFNSEGLHPKSKLIIGEIIGNKIDNPELIKG